MSMILNMYDNIIISLSNLVRRSYDGIIHCYGRARLKNYEPYIVCNNCMGGLMYHWLKLKFFTPFINCSMKNDDFVTALENFQEFMNYDIVEDEEMTKKSGFPVGRSVCDTRILFIHYESFEHAKKKWDERKSRMPRELLDDGRYYYKTENIAFMLTWGGATRDVLNRFDTLPYKHKVAFTSNSTDAEISSCIYIKDFEPSKGLWQTSSRKFSVKRVIDQFDWVTFLNNSSLI